MNNIKVTFCIIVCNGDDYIYECVKNIYPYAHSICIAEGATINWVEALKWSDPRSKDNTIQLLNKLIEEDIDNKIRIIHKLTPYKDKNEQCNYYMKLVPDDTDYIWIIDDDEFYLEEDIEKMFEILNTKKYSHVKVRMYHFWKNYETIRVGNVEPFVSRIWKYEPGYFFTNHRPMTILDKNGKNLEKIKCLNGDDHGVICRHYSFINEKRVVEKMYYYTTTFKNKNYLGDWYYPVWCKWDEKNKKNIEKNYSIHPTESNGVTIKFKEKHPKIIENKILSK